MGFKEWYLNKLKKRTVISELNGEKVYLSKGSVLSWLPFGIGKNMREWGQIYPAVDEDTGKINYINLIFGGWRNLSKLIIMFLIIAMVLIQFRENFNLINHYKEVCEPFLKNWAIN